MTDQTWNALIEREQECLRLKDRLAEAERLLQRCADYLETSATCNSDRAMASAAHAFLGTADSASEVKP